jgi:hypothetical protein
VKVAESLGAESLIPDPSSGSHVSGIKEKGKNGYNSLADSIVSRALRYLRSDN